MARDEQSGVSAPGPAMVTASRRHLTSAYARGVDRMLWEIEKRPMPDVDAVHAVIAESETEQPPDALSVGAALILLHSMRLELDCLEADVFDAGLAGGVGYEAIAAVLELTDAAAARRRQDYLGARRQLPREPPPPQRQGTVDRGSPEAAAQAGQRARQAAGRAAAAARRREELRQAPEGSKVSRADAERAAARASEAKVQAGDAAERVALGLVRAANALDRCAARCQETGDADSDPLLIRRAEEYSVAARRYREMAARYLDGGGTNDDSAWPSQGRRESR